MDPKDRSNIGNARIDGLAEDLKLDEDKFNIRYELPFCFSTTLLFVSRNNSSDNNLRQRRDFLLLIRGR